MLVVLGVGLAGVAVAALFWPSAALSVRGAAAAQLAGVVNPGNVTPIEGTTAFRLAADAQSAPRPTDGLGAAFQGPVQPNGRFF